MLLIIMFLVWLQFKKQIIRQKKNIHVVIIGTDHKRVDQVLGSLSSKKGYVIHLKGLGEQWTGFDFKLRHTLEVASQLEPDDVVMHLDAYDTYVLTDANEILNKFHKMNANIVVSTEINLYPDTEMNKIRPIIENVYPTAPNRFRWINSGTYIGYAGAIVNVLSSMPQNFNCDLPNGEKVDSSDDQRCFHTLFVQEREKHNMKLDYHQDIFHCMWGVYQYSLEPKRLYSETGSRPCVLHGNGRSDSFEQVVETIKSS